MDDRLLLAEPTTEQYRCPGESHTIDRAVHLGRLAAFYSGCLNCSHRVQEPALSTLERRQWSAIEGRQRRAPTFSAEGLCGASPNEITTDVVRQFAGSLGVVLWQQRSVASEPPGVLVGSDGHWSTADLLAAACESLRLAGCRTIEAGAVTSAALAAATHHLACDAALLVGNSTGEPHAKVLKLWGRGGRPWSSPGKLDVVRAIYQHTIDRPKRQGAALERASAAEIYLPSLGSLFHALRPLRFVIDTTCQPLVDSLNQLGAAGACEVLRPSQSHAVASKADADVPFVTRRQSVVSRQVVAEGAHFGLWIDGDGEICRLVDQRGLPVDGQRLCLLLASYVCRERPDAALVLEPHAGRDLQHALGRLGARVVIGGATREAMSEAMESTGALFAGGPSGRFWFAGKPATPDALLALSLLLTILSQSDCPVSEVLDAL